MMRYPLHHPLLLLIAHKNRVVNAVLLKNMIFMPGMLQDSVHDPLLGSPYIINRLELLSMRMVLHAIFWAN